MRKLQRFQRRLQSEWPLTPFKYVRYAKTPPGGETELGPPIESPATHPQEQLNSTAAAAGHLSQSGAHSLFSLALSDMFYETKLRLVYGRNLSTSAAPSRFVDLPFQCRSALTTIASHRALF